MPHISPVLAWFLIGIFFYAVELALPGFIVFFFGIGAWCTALAVYMMDISTSAQLGVFLVTSLATLFLLRKYIQTVFIGSTQEDDASVRAEPVADTGVVTEDIIPPGKGRVKYGGSFWKAVAEEPISTGTTVKIISQDNLEVKVRPFSNTTEVA
jgi:membrane protein implicated in regulation of membrane protease activity